MRMEAFVRKALRLKAHRVAQVEADEGAGELTVHLDRLGERRLRCGYAGFRRGARRERAARSGGGAIWRCANTWCSWYTRLTEFGTSFAGCGWSGYPGRTVGSE